MKTTQRHAIKCRCVLKQQDKREPEQFRFLTCSLLNDGVVEPSYVECPNCGIMHRVHDICRSDIQNRAELTGAVQTADEIRASLPDRVSSVMSSYELDISSWQQAQLIIDNSLWGEHVILKTELLPDDVKLVKLMRILGSTLVKVETHSGRTTV